MNMYYLGQKQPKPSWSNDWHTPFPVLNFQLCRGENAGSVALRPKECVGLLQYFNETIRSQSPGRRPMTTLIASIELFPAEIMYLSQRTCFIFAQRSLVVFHPGMGLVKKRRRPSNWNLEFFPTLWGLAWTINGRKYIGLVHYLYINVHTPRAQTIWVCSWWMNK